MKSHEQIMEHNRFPWKITIVRVLDLPLLLECLIMTERTFFVSASLCENCQNCEADSITFWSLIPYDAMNETAVFIFLHRFLIVLQMHCCILDE